MLCRDRLSAGRAALCSSATRDCQLYSRQKKSEPRSNGPTRSTTSALSRRSMNECRAALKPGLGASLDSRCDRRCHSGNGNRKLPKHSRELILAIRRVASARLLIGRHRALIAKLEREGRPTIEERTSLKTCESALQNLLAHGREIRKAHLDEGCSPQRRGRGASSPRQQRDGLPFPQAALKNEIQ
jgi:hypothetical protein